MKINKSVKVIAQQRNRNKSFAAVLYGFSGADY